MTDITELAQREKFEAWAEEAGALPWGILGKHRKQDGNYPGPHYTYMWKAWQAASAELVEALEKAQQRIAQLESRTVSVKPMRPGHINVGGEKIGIYMRDEVDEFMAALTTAGIKWEAE